MPRSLTVRLARFRLQVLFHRPEDPLSFVKAIVSNKLNKVGDRPPPNP